MKITRYINIDDSFINEPNKNRLEIKKVADEWYLKMLSIVPEEIINKEIIGELEEVIKCASAWNDFAGIGVIKDGETKELTSDTNKRKMGALAYLFKYMVEQFTDDNRDMRYEGRGPLTDLEKNYRIIFHDWESIYQDVFIVWFCLCKIVPRGHFINEAKIRHIETKPFLEAGDNRDNLSTENAEKIAKKLIENNLIEKCDTNDFIWYFCGEKVRKDRQKPGALYWKAGSYNFAYFCYKMRYACKTKGFQSITPWKNMLLIFSKNEFIVHNLSDNLSEIQDTINQYKNKENKRNGARMVSTLDNIFEDI